MDVNVTSIGTGVFISLAGAMLIDIVRNTYKKHSVKTTTPPPPPPSYNGEERREGMKIINESILELKKQMDEMRKEFRREVETVSLKVDNWANKLLEFYAKKGDLDKINDKITEITREIGEAKTESKGLRGQLSDITIRLNDHLDNHKKDY